MASAEWFFSTMAQTVSALIGFLITIVLVVHELDQRERRTRTEELRNHLLDIQKKYEGVLFTIMEAINQPFDQDISVDTDPNETTIDEIIEDIKFESKRMPIATKIWFLCYKMDNMVSDISPAESPKEDRLLDSDEIDQLIRACKYILDKTDGNESELTIEINEVGEVEDVGVSAPIFDMNDIDQPDLDQWFNDVLGEQDRRRSLDGSDILSISNLVNELNDDMERAKRLATNTLLENTTILSKTKYPLLTMLISGVFLPIAALISPPLLILEISGSELIIYEIIILVMVFASFFWLLHRISDEI